MGDDHEQLGDFLRSRRERLKPSHVGLSDTRRRRTPGLRREEVAQLAGISAEWYIKLEQGRAVAPSPATVEALARALRLNEGELAHLRALVRGGRRPAAAPEAVPDTLRRLVENIAYPAYVTGLRWDMLAWNEAASELFGDFHRLMHGERNILRHVLTTANGRALFGEHWAGEARRMVSLLRTAYDTSGDDAGFAELVASLHSGCAEFGAWWSAHDIATPVSGAKELQHPTRGRLRFSYTTLQANDDPRLKLVVYLPQS